VPADVQGREGTAILDNTDDDPDGGYAGVYVENSTLIGKPLPAVRQLGYHWFGTIEPQPGNLSLNLPLDTTGDDATDGYAFVDAYYCPGVDGVVDVVNDPECGIWYLGVEYDNWAALVAAFPTGKIADDDSLPFVVAERTPAEPPALWVVRNVKFGKGGKVGPDARTRWRARRAPSRLRRGPPAATPDLAVACSGAPAGFRCERSSELPTPHWATSPVAQRANASQASVPDATSRSGCDTINASPPHSVTGAAGRACGNPRPRARR
jgi:hypothetical protein